MKEQNVPSVPRFDDLTGLDWLGGELLSKVNSMASEEGQTTKHLLAKLVAQAIEQPQQKPDISPFTLNGTQ